MSDEINKNLIKIQKQNEIIISFLARLALDNGQIKKIVCFKKSNPKKYVDGYNACDGKHSVNDLVEIV